MGKKKGNSRTYSKPAINTKPKAEAAAVSPSGRINAFDSLKGLAILIAVVIGHYWQFTPAGYYAGGEPGFWVNLTNKITEFSFMKSYTFMELLFMIGGFQLFAYYKRIENDEVSFVDYMKRRCSRLFPMTIITTVFMYIFGAIYLHLTGEFWGNITLELYQFWQSIFNVQVWISNIHFYNGPLWYVSVYFLCIILFYFLVRLGKSTKIGIFAMCIPMLAAVAINYYGLAIPFMNPDLGRGYYAFFLGVFVAYILPKLQKDTVYKFCFFSIIAYVILYTFFKDLVYSDNRFDLVLITTICFYAPLLMLFATNKKLDSIVGNKVLVGLGKISYSMYVWNFPFYLFLVVFEKAFSVEILYGQVHMYYIFAIAQVLWAVVSYNFIEKPIYKALGRT